MRNLFCLIIIYLLVFEVYAQNNAEKKVGTIKVSNPPKTVIVEPKDDVLFIGERKKLKIKISGKGKIGKVEMNGANISGKDSIYYAEAVKGNKAILSVYEKAPDNSIPLLYTKVYKIFKLYVPPEVIITVDGVKNDSVIDKQIITAVGRLTARKGNTGEKLKILSFHMQMANTRVMDMDTLKAQGNSLTRKMRELIDDMKDGSLVYFDSIRCLMPDNTIKILGPVRIYIKEGEIPHLFGM